MDQQHFQLLRRFHVQNFPHITHELVASHLADLSMKGEITMRKSLIDSVIEEQTRRERETIRNKELLELFSKLKLRIEELIGTAEDMDESGDPEESIQVLYGEPVHDLFEQIANLLEEATDDSAK